MDSIQIDTGVKRIIVNDDPERVIVFNPSDVMFAEKFYQLIRDFEGKQAEFQKRAQDLDTDELDDLGIPANIKAGIDLLREMCEYLREKIDDLFGSGTSQAAFQNANTLEMFEQFFDGIMPFIQQARSAKIEKHTVTKRGRRIMKAK